MKYLFEVPEKMALTSTTTFFFLRVEGERTTWGYTEEEGGRGKGKETAPILKGIHINK